MTDDELREAVENHYYATLHDFAEMNPVDSWVEKDGRVVAYVERKTRNVTFGTYPTAVVDARKWIGLLAAEYATGVPAYLFVGWACGTWGWVQPAKVGNVLGTRILTPGPESVSLNAGVPRPVVEVPVDAFTIANRL